MKIRDVVFIVFAIISGIVLADISHMIWGNIKRSRPDDLNSVEIHGLSVSNLVNTGIIVRDGPVNSTVIMFGDYYCPACVRSYRDLVRYWEEIGGNFRFVYHFAPSGHRRSEEASMMAYCISKQIGIDKVNRQIYSMNSDLDYWSIKEFIDENKINSLIYNECFDSDGKNYIKKSIIVCKNADIRMTPTFFIEKNKKTYKCFLVKDVKKLVKNR